MNAAHFRRLFDYNYWAHKRVWGCTTELSDEQFYRPSDFSVGSVHEQLVHTMGAEWLWLQRAKVVPPDPFPQAADYPTRESIRARWDEVEREWGGYVNHLEDAQLDETFAFISINGNARREIQRWEALATIINHSTDHRAQTMALIHQLGGKTVEQDFVFYTWEHPAVQG
jgi:uncharacterized damage-inducible protein DinB